MKILAYTSPMRGHLFPIVPVLEELHARRHRVTACTIGDHLDDLRALGLDAHAVDPALEAMALDDWRAKTPIGAQRRAMGTFARRAPLDAADLRLALERTEPDVVVVDIMALGAVAAAEASGLPWAAWLPYPAWLRGPTVPPFGPGLAPRAGRLGRLRDALVGGAGRLGPERNVTAAVNAGRAAVGLRPLSRADHVLVRPPTLLSLTAEPFEYHRRWPPSFRLIGPCPWEPPAPVPAPVIDDDRPIVLVTTSSDEQRDQSLIATAIAALARRKDVQVLATAPAGTSLPDAASPNARMLRFVPHGSILDRVSVVVCHGGMGTTQKALAHGVPVCAVPFGRDQHEVARRLEVCGAGVRLPATRLTDDRLRDAIDRAMALRPGAERVAAAFAAAGGPSAGADAIEATNRG